MASLSIHNVQSVQVTEQTHDTFCTLQLSITTKHKSDKAPVYETIELYFNTNEARQAFIETIAFQYEGA